MGIPFKDVSLLEVHPFQDMPDVEGVLGAIHDALKAGGRLVASIAFRAVTPRSENRSQTRREQSGFPSSFNALLRARAQS